MSDARQIAHELIDQLPEAQLSGMVQFLETIVDPQSRDLRNAPLDDEPESEQEKHAVAEAEEWLAGHGKGISHKEAMRSLGLE